MGDADPWAGMRRMPPRGGPRSHPAIERVAAGTRWWRVHRLTRDGDGFSAAVPGAYSGGRFDCTDGSYGVLYAADSFAGAVAETVLRDTPLVDAGERVIPRAAVAGRGVSVLETTRDLSLAVLHGPGLAKVGQGLWLTKCDAIDYPLTREWGRALHDREPGIDGLVWRARFDEDRLALVLFGDRCAGALGVVATAPVDEGAGLEGLRRVLLDHSAAIEG